MTRTFEVLLSRKADVESALALLVKRANRKGIPNALAWTWGKAYESTATIPNVAPYHAPTPSASLSPGGTEWIVKVTRVPLTIEGSTPRHAGWKFVATLQHLDGENIVRVLPGETIPSMYRSRKSHCDHCRTLRRRNDTYVLMHEETGRYMQVGSSCIRDFLGADDASIIAAKAEILALAASVASGEDSLGFGGGGAVEHLLSRFMPYVSASIRLYGWKSRTVAREQGGLASADDAWGFYTDPKKRELTPDFQITEEDEKEATAAVEWAEALSDAEVESATSDYLHNLRAVARTGLVSFRTAGIIGSAIVAYQRFIGKQRAAKERAERPRQDVYLGAEGDKLSFGLPAKVGKRGQPVKGAPVVVSEQPVTLDFVTGYETEYGYTTVLKFRTAEGALVVWKATATELKRDDVGKRYTLVGTVKKHDEYKGEKQTILTRCNVTEVAEEAS